MMPIIGKVEQYINDKLKQDGAIFHILIDPCDYPTPQKAIDTALAAAEAGADIIGIGGSTGVQGELLDSVIAGIKKGTDIPILLFPGNITTVSPQADAVLYMSLLNSRNPYWISGAQMLSAPMIKKTLRGFSSFIFSISRCRLFDPCPIDQ